MELSSIGRGARRKLANRTLAFYVESQGLEWVSVRDAVVLISAQLGVRTDRKRRSDIAIECQEKILAMGHDPHSEYLAPWERGETAPILKASKRRNGDSIVGSFYSSFEWKRLRFEILRTRGRVCECCGAGPQNSQIHVDHIKPVRKHWSLRLEPMNLQVLCEPCNLGKGSLYSDDFRGVD